ASSPARSTRRRGGRVRYTGGCVGLWSLGLWRTCSSRILAFKPGPWKKHDADSKPRASCPTPTRRRRSKA
ncbi:hypothetical protein JI435_086510, partial [Parastagonospora nodorum SN15]